MLSARDIRGMYAIIATPALPGAEGLDATDTVDLAETERLIRALLRDGASGLIVLGTTGECATLSDPDYRAFVGCVVETVGRSVPTIVGASALGGHAVASRLRMLRDLRVDGTLLGLPMWQPMTTRMSVDFYAEVSRVFPELAVMVYANARAFRFDFPQAFWEALVQAAPTAVAAKHSVVPGLRALLDATQERINFVPSDMAVHEFHAISPHTTTACWATSAGMGPAPAVAIMQALAQGNRAAVQEISAAIAWANEPFLPILRNPELFARYNIQVEKIRINEAGYSHCGPVRSPYSDFPEEHAEPSRECGRRWARICKAYRGDFQFDERPWAQQAAA